MEECGLQQSKLDPCIFVGENIMCIVYVGYLIFWEKNEDNIHDIVM